VIETISWEIMNIGHWKHMNLFKTSWSVHAWIAGDEMRVYPTEMIRHAIQCRFETSPRNNYLRISDLNFGKQENHSRTQSLLVMREQKLWFSWGIRMIDGHWRDRENWYLLWTLWEHRRTHK
jgi:hypothetical protein